MEAAEEAEECLRAEGETSWDTMIEPGGQDKGTGRDGTGRMQMRAVRPVTRRYDGK